MQPEPTKLYAGTFERSMDAKKRVAVPSGWLQKKEGEEFYVLPHPGGEYLIVMPPGELMNWGPKFQARDGVSAAEMRTAERRFFAAAHRVATDSQGRILVPEEHCEPLGLKGPVVFIGGRNRFELWEKDRYARSMAQSDDSYRKIAEEIGL